MSSTEAGRALGMTPGAVRIALFRARRALRKSFVSRFGAFGVAAAAWCRRNLQVPVASQVVSACFAMFVLVPAAPGSISAQDVGRGAKDAAGHTLWRTVRDLDDGGSAAVESAGAPGRDHNEPVEMPSRGARKSLDGTVELCVDMVCAGTGDAPPKAAVNQLLITVPGVAGEPDRHVWVTPAVVDVCPVAPSTPVTQCRSAPS